MEELVEVFKMCDTDTDTKNFVLKRSDCVEGIFRFGHLHSMMRMKNVSCFLSSRETVIHSYPLFMEPQCMSFRAHSETPSVPKFLKRKT